MWQKTVGKYAILYRKLKKNMAALRMLYLTLGFVIRTIYMKFSMKMDHKYTHHYHKYSHHIFYVRNFKHGDNVLFVIYI